MSSVVPSCSRRPIIIHDGSKSSRRRPFVYGKRRRLVIAVAVMIHEIDSAVVGMYVGTLYVRKYVRVYYVWTPVYLRIHTLNVVGILGTESRAMSSR
ncbi:hypothetical protein GGS24DRAFT_475921 [Hypoxylon argillaceum]|nr:hypothetical protein GGS24DRAFT_475921 [Hypoxylon argillaceum]